MTLNNKFYSSPQTFTWTLPVCCLKSKCISRFPERCRFTGILPIFAHIKQSSDLADFYSKMFDFLFKSLGIVVPKQYFGKEWSLHSLHPVKWLSARAIVRIFLKSVPGSPNRTKWIPSRASHWTLLSFAILNVHANIRTHRHSIRKQISAWQVREVQIVCVCVCVFGDIENKNGFFY